MNHKVNELKRILEDLRHMSKNIPYMSKIEQSSVKETDKENTEENIKDIDKTKVLQDIEDARILENAKVIQKITNERDELLIKLTQYELKLKNILDENNELKKKVKIQRDEIINCKGAIRVVCRIKPCKIRGALSFNDRSITIDNKRFNVDKVFTPNSSQSDIFNEIGPLVEGIMDGFNVCVFAYGQTGSGKTYTMEGNEENKGLIFRSLEGLENISKIAISEGAKISYKIKYLEIYNENIRDLIGGEQVQIIDENNSVRLKSCKEIETNSFANICDIIRQNASKRVIGGTKCNEMSSRSHLVFMLTIEINIGLEKRVGCLSLIDLAGSERLSESKAENERLRETQNINKSLSALGNVFNAIKRKDRHIPFRDSKLTHLMKEYLIGQSRTTMIVNINPESINETICSMRFAAKVSACELGSAVKNIDGCS